MTLAEIIAAKKAAALQPTITQEGATVPTIQELEHKHESIIAALIIPPAIINTEVAVTHVPKKLSFQELMLRKQAGVISAQTVVAGNVNTPTDASFIITATEEDKEEGAESKKVQAVSTLVPVVTAQIVNIPALDDIMTLANRKLLEANDGCIASLQTPEGIASPEAAQAYADLRIRIDALLALSDTPLENAMKDLKRALLANPNAVALMEDTDFGKMVIALRNLTKEAATDAASDKASGKKSKFKIDLDPAAIALAFEDI